MGKNTPDFRKMSPDQIRDNISQLNKLISWLRQDYTQKKKGFVKAYGVTTVGAVTVATAFPALALLAFTFPLVATLETSVEAQIVGDTLREAEKLRSRFKEVYRARPGRRQFNLAARREREKNRKPKGIKKFLPKFPGK